MGRPTTSLWQTFLTEFGFKKETQIVYENCLNCGKKLSGRQTMFCSKKCNSYYHNVKTKIKQKRQ